MYVALLAVNYEQNEHTQNTNMNIHDLLKFFRKLSMYHNVVSCMSKSLDIIVEKCYIHEKTTLKINDVVPYIQHR